ncbi:MAG TPA: beta-ketoacyl-[acyl-carrier-protein] synthase family protein [Candidatus Desulfofervidus auxilii]|uniref:3-oxoacyl-[acyl-carrier-protein] synthase 2 n=1 Tax=Desulfofervidus auxilii TaxID=1621989 RepID=A0A7C1ZE32_DESA2|nr:beta-ketoacyl-[acyl-carrier-protein] synthase family protein [Candidatus Desulfofervidus auxilii]
MKRQVVITGIGVIAPNGVGKDAFWQAVINGKTGIGRVSRFDTSGYASQVAGEVNDFDPTDYMSPKTARRIDRFSQFGLACTKMALEDAGLILDREDYSKVGIAVGSAIGGLPFAEQQHSIFLEKGLNRVFPLLSTRLFPGTCANQICIEIGIRGKCSVISTGCATGVDNIAYAFETIKSGECDIMIAGAAEAPLAPLTYASFCLIGVMSRKESRTPKPFDKYRDGIVLSEGGAILVLEHIKHALKRGAHIYAEVAGYGTTHDAFHLTQPSPDGKQAEKAIKLALKHADLQPEDISYINAHGSATPLNDKIETNIIKNVFGEHAFQIPISSIESMIGHPLGASSAIKIAASALSIANGVIPPTINYEYPDPDCDLDYVPKKGRKSNLEAVLCNAFSFGGKNSILVLKKYRG